MTAQVTTRIPMYVRIHGRYHIDSKPLSFSRPLHPSSFSNSTTRTSTSSRLAYFVAAWLSRLDNSRPSNMSLSFLILLLPHPRRPSFNQIRSQTVPYWTSISRTANPPLDLPPPNRRVRDFLSRCGCLHYDLCALGWGGKVGGSGIFRHPSCCPCVSLSLFRRGLRLDYGYC